MPWHGLSSPMVCPSYTTARSKATGDPNNREALGLSGYQTQNKPLLTHIMSLNQARKAAIDASSTFLTTPIHENTQLQRQLAHHLQTALLTNVGNASVSWWGVLNVGYSANANLMEVLTCTTMQEDGQGGVNANTGNGQPMIILPAPALAGSSLCNGGQATGTGKGNGAFSIRGALEGGPPWLLVQLAVVGSLLLGLA
ncbi:hypothetical protein JB92DRAFT_3093167 [Gautieria morchelliformis]|nr:hypothetical protein JB92DRAFT_3093167 [Gautieria morchelliformis]